MSYRSDRAWSDQFIQSICQIVGPLLLTEAPLKIDQEENTDLIVLSVDAKRIACRVRRHGYADRYPNEFTIRCRRDSGMETELSKIINGFGDWMFYGHQAALDTIEIDPWMLLDLRPFRGGLIRHLNHQHVLRCGVKPNDDGTHFKWYDATSFPENPPLIVAQSASIRVPLR